jgi:RNA polymerase sigma-70 factor (ECF subfamily)
MKGINAAMGNMEAFEKIVEAYGDLVFNVSLRMLHNREDAEEVSQEVFMTVYRKLKDFEGRSSLKTWIYRIAVNVAIDHGRRLAGRRNRTVEYDEAGDAATVEHAAVEIAEAEYKKRTVDRLLGELSEGQRACMVLRSVEGLSYEEIAGVLKIDVNAVRSRLKRARERMLTLREEVMHDEM